MIPHPIKMVLIILSLKQKKEFETIFQTLIFYLNNSNSEG